VKIFWMKMRRVLQWLWARFLSASGCLWWAKRQLRGNGAVVALIFHRVLDESSYRTTRSQPEIVVRENTFRELVAHIASRFEPVDLREAAPGKLGEKLRVAITFDDGWEDNYTVAFPIICKYGIPVIIFVTSGFVGMNAPFWPEQVIGLLRAMNSSIENTEIEAMIESLKKHSAEEREQCLVKLLEQASEKGMSLQPSSIDRTLSWQEIWEMDRIGVEIGSHTQTHQILTTVGTDTARQEVLESKATIERALGKLCDVFSYPNGNWSPETRNMLAESGFRFAVTTDPGAWTAACDPLCIPRVNVYEGKVVGLTGRFSPAMFEYMTFWKAWRATRAKSRLRVEPNSSLCQATR
jgi:peptidoglycan/xylan/chitin deacetylase (PgdA/CDA1 family)